VAGVQAQSEKVWRQADSHKIPRIVFVNKLDRVGADIGHVLRTLEATFGVQPLLTQLPLVKKLAGGNEEIVGVCDLVAMQVFEWNNASDPDGKTFAVRPAAAGGDEESIDLAKRAKDARAALVTSAADMDDELMESLFEVRVRRARAQHVVLARTLQFRLYGWMRLMALIDSIRWS
jgi:elongation factor G